MDQRDRKQIIAEDGSIYEVETVHFSHAALTYALVVNQEMQTAAVRLLPFAQKMAEARAKRATFYRDSERRLEVFGGYAFAQAEEAAREAQVHVGALCLVAKGVALEERQVVTVEMWRKLMVFFHQEVSLGSLNVKG